MTTDQPDTAVQLDTAAKLREVREAVGQVIVGKDAELELVLVAVLARGHVLIEDVPGVGKTRAARALASALGLDFRRAQFTPDLLPSDLTGSMVWDERTRDFSFRKGPLFTGILLADEVNRSPAKTQSALLEAMAEGQVSLDGVSHPLPRPFHVFATSNPIEYEGTFSLPEAQLDRFLLRVRFGYPDPEQERQVVRASFAEGAADRQPSQVLTAQELMLLQSAVERVQVDESIVGYCVDLAVATREHPATAVGVSPRGTLAVAHCARAYAVLRGRDFVIPDDVLAVARAVMEHRVVMRPELWGSQKDASTVVADVLVRVPTPHPRPS